MRTTLTLAAIGGLGIASVAMGLDAVDETVGQFDPRVAATNAQPGKTDFPSFDSVTKDHRKVISTVDGKPGMYTLYVNDKTGDVLAELPRNFAKKNVFIAYTISGGIGQSGVQAGDMYARWEQFGKRLGLIRPNFEVRTSGDSQSKAGHRRVHTDSVILDIPIKSIGPGGGPVIDMTDLLVKNSSKFFGGRTAGANTRLAKIEKAKAFPSNIELSYTMPLRGGKFGTLAYSFADIPENTGYKPRKADERLGYFTTAYRDIGDASDNTPWNRYINRWNLQKADPSLKMSPPKEPIIFYVEHTTPVRYRRWVRDGILEWNKAFEKVGIVNAIEVYQQDQATGAHMEKDPEDARYNFVLWTNSGMGFAIGPSRVHPKTGQILDADIVMDEGFITGWSRTWDDLIPETALEGWGPEAMAWLDTNPQWHPRVLLAPRAMRNEVLQQVKREATMRSAGLLPGHASPVNATELIGDEEFDGLLGRVSQVNGNCRHAACKAMDVAMLRLSPEIIMGIDVPKVAKGPEKDPVSGTWRGTIEMSGPDGQSHAMDIMLELQMDKDHSVTGSAEMGPFGIVEMAGTWTPDSNTLMLVPVEPASEDADALELTIRDGQMSGAANEGEFSMSITATREHGPASHDDHDDDSGSHDDDEDEAHDDDDDDHADHDEDGHDEDAHEHDEDSDAKPAKQANKGEEQYLDGVPEVFIGPMLKEVIMHEVGHTLGLRHNFKGSTIHSLEDINSEDFEGTTVCGSVMDYLPININYELGETQGDWTMKTIGPYDYWVIEYGYTGKNPEKVLERVNDAELIYATDEDTWGPDPRARRFDHGANPLNYAQSQLGLVEHLRERILDEMVEDGESWAEARKAYNMLLGKQQGAVNIAANWIGGSYVNRGKKGDPGDRAPIEPLEAEMQRRALEIVLNHTMQDEAYGLTPELLRHMTVDKWWDDGGQGDIRSDEVYQVHNRIAGLQAMAMNAVLNPQTLNRVYDNEFHAMGEVDVITVPEVMNTLRDSVWTEVDEGPAGAYTATAPYISSLRRNAQRQHLDRLIDMSLPAGGSSFYTAPVTNLSRAQLRELKGTIDSALRRSGSDIDPYSAAHLAEASSLIDRALNAQYLYNTDDISGGSGSMMPFIRGGSAEAPVN